MRRIYDLITYPIIEKWIGSLQASAVVRSLYLQHTIAQQIPPGESMRILDAGCGEEAAATIVLARRYPGCSFTALDLFLRSREGGHLPVPGNIGFIESDIFQYRPEKKFDLITCLDVLEHIEAATDVINLLNTWTDKGGFLIVHVPSAGQVRYLTKKESGVHSDREPRPGDDHVRDGYDTLDIERDIEGAGYTILSSQYTFSSMTWFFKEIYSVLERNGIKGTGLLMLPIIYLSTRIEMLRKLSRGNGVLVVARKKS